VKVLVAGATGSIGQQLVPQLLADGHDVVALARSTRRAQRLADLGAEVVTGDALDRAQVIRIVADAKPDAVVNLLTALPPNIDPKHIDRDMAQTNRLRTEGAKNVFDAADEVGVATNIVESVAFMTDPCRPPVTDESAPLWQAPPKKFASAVAAVADLEQRASEHGATVLRFGHLYGPGTALGPDGAFAAQVRAGKMPLLGDGASIFSFLHTADAASAVTVALTNAQPGVFNIVDDEPAPISEWLPELAKVLGAPAPKRLPSWIARIAVGEYGVAYMTALRGSSNRRAKETLGWNPSRPTWRKGFLEVFGGASVNAQAHA
jgi:nucleoside-diphosphate-sugar epimerase